MATKHDLKKSLKKLHKALGRLIEAAPSSFYSREALNPIDNKKLETLLIAIGFNNYDISKMREVEKRRLFKMALQYNDLYKKWISEVTDRRIALAYPKPKRTSQRTQLEREVGNLAGKIREEIKNTGTGKGS